jgi:SAM-dependent methyltransferase
MTTRDQARAFFDSIAGRYDRVYAPGPEESRARMARVLTELAPTSRVLDLGVGTGRELSSLQDAGHVVTGLDLSPEMLARCARRTRPVLLVEADLWDRLPFEAGAFDAVIALHGTLAHPPGEAAPRALAVELARVLAPSGVFVMEVPLPPWIDKAVEAIRHPSRGHAKPGALRKVGDSQAVMTDDVTGASIDTRLFTPHEWKEALSRLTIIQACEERDELFLVARKT